MLGKHEDKGAAKKNSRTLYFFHGFTVRKLGIVSKTNLVVIQCIAQLENRIVNIKICVLVNCPVRPHVSHFFYIYL